VFIFHNKMFHAAKLTSKCLASPTVMLVELKVPTLTSFDPGQWVDFVAPPHDWVGGFSIASPPSDLPQLTLAIKKSRARASSWVHTDATIGADLRIRVGGNCTLAGDDFDKPAVFCAGGIGIVPVLGNYRAYLARQQQKDTQSPPSMFFYSIPTQDEFVFGDELVQLFHSHQEQQNGDQKNRMVCALTKSKEWTSAEKISGNDSGNNQVELRLGRYLNDFLDAAPKDALFYICGPPAMNNEAASYLEAKGVPTANIRYEKWW
jgi:ferredoxin-NADP reductase